MAKRGRRSESGDTLIEVLLAIVVLGLASVAIMLAFATSISGSAEHRSLTTFDTVLRSASEQAVSQLQQQTTSEFGTCPGNYNVTFALPSGYTAAVTQVQYWNGSNFGSVASPNPCVINAPQLITITVTSSTGSSYSISVVVDGPLARPISCATTATQLVFLQLPSVGTSVAGGAFGNQPQVAIEGANGQYVCNDLSYLTLTLNPVSAPNGANLSGCSGSELGGVVSFSGCSTIGAGTYTLTATDGSLTKTSSQFTVVAGLPTQLVFSPSTPGPATAGIPIPNVTVQAEDSYGNVVYTDSDVVTMSINTGSTPFTFSSGTTATASMSNGVARFNNLYEDIPGAYSLTATDGSLSQTSGSFALGVGPVSTANSSVNDSPATVIANGTSSSTITVTLVDAYGDPISGKTVSLSDGAANSTISPASGTSNSSGIVTFTVTDITAESATYTATDASDGVTIADTAVVTFTPGAVSRTLSTVTQSPSSVPADGATPSTVTVTLEDANGNAVPGKTVSLHGTGSSSISAPSGLSNANGVVTFTVQDSHAQTVIYTATDTTDNYAITDTATVVFYGPASGSLSTVSSSPSSVLDDGVTTSTVTVTLEDANGNAVPGKTVTLTGTGSSSISAPSGPSDASGVVTFTVKDSHAQTVTYTATDFTDSVPIAHTATVAFVGTASRTLSTVNQSPNSVVANGNSTSTITVTLLDSAGNPVPNKTVALSQGAGDSTISAPSGASNSAGVVTFTVSDSMTQIITYSAVDYTDGVLINDTASVTFVAGPVSAANSTVNPTLGNVADDGATSTTVTVTLLDANDNPVSGKTVILNGTGNSTSISPASGTSNASGVVTFTVTDTRAQTVTYTATVTGTGGTVINDTAAVVFYTPLTTVSRGLSSVSQSVSNVADDGVTTSTITVTVLDGNGNAVPNRTVALNGTGNSTSISPASGTSNASGVVTFTVTDTRAQTVTYTATVTGTGGGAITDTAAVVFYTPLAVSRTSSTVNPSFSNVADDGVTTSTITVTLLDSNGNAVPGKSVTLNGTGSSVISAASGVSNASGVVTFTVTDTNAEAVTYTATDTTNSITLSDTAAVTFYTPGAVTSSSLTANPTNPAHTSYSTITVTLRDSNGNAVPNKTVTLTQSSGGASIISPTSALSDASGVVTFVVSGTVRQNVTYTATDVPDNLSGTVTVDFS